MRVLIVVSGPVTVGKSAFISELIERFGAVRVSTRLLIQSLRSVTNERRALQEAGEALDRETSGKWITDALVERMNEFGDHSIVVVDSIRIGEQVKHLREKFGEKVWHVHLTASDRTLTKRFEKRKSQGDPGCCESKTYEEVRTNGTETHIEKLGDIANERVVTDRLDPGSVATLAIEKLKLFPTSIKPLVDVVIGGQYGSEGKGNICDYLAKDYDVLVRVGGPNAGHRVAKPKYDYIHLPSGTGGYPKTKLMIGAGAVLDIVRLLKEIIDHDIQPARLSIDPQAIVIEQSDRESEEELGNQIGSTKKGVGVATARKITCRGTARTKVRLVRDIPELEPYMRSVTAELELLYAAEKRILLEGTQGTDLSIHHGIYPYVTSRETTASGCLADVGISPRRVNKIYIVIRTYPIRVGGNSGEIGIEIDYEEIANRSGAPLEEIKTTEIGTVSKKPRRIAEFSWERVRRAVQLNGATDIVLTFADYIDYSNRYAKTFDDLTDKTKKFIGNLERITGVPVTLVSVGVGHDKILENKH